MLHLASFAMTHASSQAGFERFLASLLWAKEWQIELKCLRKPGHGRERKANSASHGGQAERRTSSADFWLEAARVNTCTTLQ